MKSTLTLLLYLIAIAGAHAQDISPQMHRDAKVFVVAPDKGAITHGNDALNAWNYWRVVDKQDDADLIVNFKIHRSYSYEYKGYAEISNAKTHEILLTTKDYNTSWKFNNRGFNEKRIIIERLVSDRIKPLIDPDKN